MKKFLKIIPPAFGLDISDSSYKLIQLKPKGKHYALTACGEATLPKGIVESGHIAKPEELSKFLQEALKPYKEKGLSRYVVLSLPDEEVFLKMIRLPKAGNGELQNMVQVEAERNMPIQIEKTYLGHYPLRAHGENSDHIDIMVAAAKKETADTYSDIIVEAGFFPVVIEPEVSAIGRSAIKAGHTEGAVIIVEIGANRTRLITFLYDSVILTASVNFSANEAVVSIAKALGIDAEQAQKLKWDKKLLNDPQYGQKLDEALSPLFYHLGESINNYIGFMNESYKDRMAKVPKVEKIIVSGGGSRIPGIEKQLTMILRTPVEIVNPWINVLPYPLKETPELSQEESVKYTTAIGLALRGVKKDGIL